MFPPPEVTEPLTERIIGCAIEVHKALGAGLLESVYRECMCIELMTAGLEFESERQIQLSYKGTRIDSKLWLDLLIEGTSNHVLNAQRMPGRSVDEFQRDVMKNGIRRLYHPELYTPSKRDSAS